MPPVIRRWALGRHPARTVLVDDTGRPALAALLGLPGDAGHRAPETDGLFDLRSTGAPHGHPLVLRQVTPMRDGLRLELATADGALRVRSTWTTHPATGVLSRRDTVTNHSRRRVVLTCARPRFTLARGVYRLYAQASSWGAESQGAWHNLVPGTALAWGSDRGRLCIPASPYAVIVPAAGGSGLAIHVLTGGNWVIRARTTDASFSDGGPHAVLEAGLADAALALPLAPGASHACPELLLQAVPGGDPAAAAPALQRFLLGRDLLAQRRDPPAVYNTWFDRYDDLDPARLVRQARIARDLGCEVFTVDAGWFGHAGVRWDRLVGEWREKPDAAFRGRMRAFADRIRGMGLGFGLWMEPERIARAAPIARAHPDWVIESLPGGEYRLDVEHPRARAWLKEEVARTIRTYQLKWLKVDSNLFLGPDPRGRELSGYFAAWWGLLDGWRRDHPDCFIEGCSSGCLRLDGSALAHHEAHFLSDNVTPADMFRILQGTALRVPPSRLTLWTVLRTTPGRGVVAPHIHNWGTHVPADPDFVAAICLPGILTLSGDPESLPPAARARLRHWVGFWKARRTWLTGSVCRLLTPPRPLADHTGWAALQVEDTAGPRRLLLAYRLDDPAAGWRLRAAALEARRRYAVTDAGDGTGLGVFTGATLMRRGLAIRQPRRFTARVLELTPA